MDVKTLKKIGILFSCIFLISGCSVIAGIFKAGFWTGIILVVLVVGLLIYGISKIGNDD